MAMRFDVVVIGGGISGGLSSAAYLQKAGLRVAVVEKRHKVGTFAPTSDPWPGAIMDPHASQNWSTLSPAVEDLELEKYGYKAVYAPAPNGTTHKDGVNVLVYLDPDQTARSFGRLSERDGRTIRRLQTGLLKDAVEIAETLCFTAPETEPDRVMEMAMGLGRYVGIDPDTFSRINGVQLLEELFESDHIRRTLAIFAAHHYAGHILAMGHGSFAVLASFLLICAAGWNIGGIYNVAQSVTRCFLDHGGVILHNCPVQQIIIRDGEAIGVRLADDAAYPGQVIYADKAVISDVGAKLTLDLISEDVMRSIDSRLAAKMKYWKTYYRGGCLSFWILKDRPIWKSERWNPDISRTADFYQAWDSWAQCKEWLLAMQNNERLDGLNAELSDFSAIDPKGRSPEGYIVFRSEEPLPFHLPAEGGPERWDDLREEIAARRNDVMEELAPGFKDKIVKQWIQTPLDVWRYNSAAVGGAIVGGDFSEDQWILTRMPYRMPVKRLYMANSVWPVAATWMAPGYNCACLVAEDLGIRHQPWWRHRPLEWLLRNLPSLIVS
ncbi:MAG: hypothetical protein C4316_13000 [Chloroflexota bacterium]